MSIGKRNNSVGTTFTAPTNSLMPLSPEERQRLGLQMTQTLGNTNLMDFGQFNSGQQVPIGVAGVPEKIPATNIPKVSKFGNLLARMGGMDSKDIIGVNDINNTKMTQEQMDNYSQQRSTARGKGMSDLLLALGTAFKGEDIIKTVGDARDKRTLAEETARMTDLNTQMAEAYRQGDYEKVRALALEMNDPSMNQAIFNNMNKDMSTVSPDGKLILERDQQGNIISAKPNTSVIEAIDPKELGYSAIKDINEGEAKIKSMNNTSDEIDGFIEMIDNKDAFDTDFELLEDRAKQVRDNIDFQSLVSQAMADKINNWNNEYDHIEQMIYTGGFPSKQDKDLMADFHRIDSAQERIKICRNIEDQRHRLFAERLICQFYPQEAPEDMMNRYQSLITQRLNEEGPWGSMSKIMTELDLSLIHI